jgi:hypothetical protein
MVRVFLTSALKEVEWSSSSGSFTFVLESRELKIERSGGQKQRNVYIDFTEISGYTDGHDTICLYAL